MKITAFMGSIHGAWLNSAKPSDFEGHVFLSRDLEDETFRDSALKALNEADLTLFYDSGEPSMAFVKDALANLEPGRRFIQLSWEPSQWGGTEEPWVNAQAQRYLTQGGPQNPSRLWAFLKALAEGSPHEAPEPLILPAWGLYHPQAPQPAYEELKDFLAWADARPTNASLNHGAVGIIFHRIYWSVGQTAIEDRIIEALEAEGLKVLPFFVDWSEDPSQGQEALAKLEKAFDGSHGPKIDVIVKLVSTLSSPGQGHEKAELFEDSPARWSVRLFKKLNVPVLQPLVSWSQNIEQWEKDPLGLGRESAWSMAMSEFEGAIEPFFVGGTLRQGLPTGTPAPRQPHWERIQRLAQRARSWANLAHTPPKDRKVAFILHNNPCGSVEGTIGVAAGLDSAQSLVKLAQAMKEVGYSVDVPQSGPELLKEILEKKAISEFRWTAAPEIVARGGALALIDPEGYNRYFASFPEKVKEEIIKTWGHPPGETIDEVPPAMLHEGRIIVAGLKLGPNAVVLPQPKRGCAGSRCDGRVCRILQDPLIAPPHQYLATYRWLQDPQGFGAHIIIHLGTLGNLEYLPGKSAGLSESCSPDLALYQSPNLYVYDSWDTGPGLTAKRRSYAVLDDHLPPAMRLAQTPKALMELEELMSQSQKNPEDPDKTAVTREAIREKILEAKLENTLGPLDGDFGELAIRIRRFLGLVSGSLVEDGLHVLGDIPEGERLTSLVAAILLFESGDSPGLRSLLAKEAGLDLLALLEDPSALTPQGATNTRILEDFDNKGTKIVSAIIAGGALEAIERELGGQSASPEAWAALIHRAQNILARVKACREILTALTALNAGYVEPGPSGNLSRGQEEALPTGRNFFAHDPRHLPTQRAYKIGQQLAEATIKKHLEDEGRFPESVAFFWISADLLQNDGEDLSQILALMGLKPLWSPSGNFLGVEAISLAELGRPRIDVLVKISGILRDSFSEIVDRLDRAVRLVADLDEPVEANFVRQHSLANLVEAQKISPENAWRQATYRIFSSPPGSWQSGVYLALMASAWRDEQDLTEIYLQHGSYAYGEGTFGELAFSAFRAALSQVDVNYSKIYSDSNDFLGCGWRFGTQGGLSVAAECLQGRKIRNYCGDGRQPLAPTVRSLKEEISRSAMSRLLNPRWLEGQKRHGYKGALEIAKRLGNVYGWQATTKEVDPGLMDVAAEMFFQDPENVAFFKEANPWALEEMGRRLMEAESRRLWSPTPELLAKVKQTYLELEGVLEEKTETFGGEIQGGSVDIFTMADVASWREKMAEFKAKAAL